MWLTWGGTRSPRLKDGSFLGKCLTPACLKAVATKEVVDLVSAARSRNPIHTAPTQVCSR